MVLDILIGAAAVSTLRKNKRVKKEIKRQQEKDKYDRIYEANERRRAENERKKIEEEKELKRYIMRYYKEKNIDVDIDELELFKSLETIKTEIELKKFFKESYAKRDLNMDEEEFIINEKILELWIKVDKYRFENDIKFFEYCKKLYQLEDKLLEINL